MSTPKPWNADEIHLGNWTPIMRVRKRPVVVHATQLNFPEGFEVTTREGKMRGKPGDWLMIGIDGEKYPCDQDIFHRTYQVLGPYEDIEAEEPLDLTEDEEKSGR